MEDLEHYPTIVATIVEIKDKSKLKHIVDRLEKHFSLSTSEANEALESLPFRLPSTFLTAKEAKTATHELSYFDCVIDIRDALLDEDTEEVEETAVVEPPEAEPVELMPQEERAPQVGIAARGDESVSEEVSPLGEERKWPKWMIPALAAAVLVLVGLLAFSLFSDDDQVGDEEGAMVEVYDDGDGDDVYTFSTDILRSVASKIESKISSIQALDLFLDNISGFVEENQITEEEQVELSEHFAEKAKEKKKDEVLSIFAMRSLKMLKVAISFNPRNRNAWNQMIELYKLNGLKLRAKKAQKEMDAVFADD